jgi:hypothetical protein
LPASEGDEEGEDDERDEHACREQDADARRQRGRLRADGRAQARQVAGERPRLTSARASRRQRGG